MKIQDLIDDLRAYPPDAEVNIATVDGREWDVGAIYMTNGVFWIDVDQRERKTN